MQPIITQSTDLTIKQGRAFELVIIGNSSFNDYSYKAQIRDNNKSLIADFNIVKSLVESQTQLILSLTDSQTATIPTGSNYKWDLKTIVDDNKSFNLLEGKVEVLWTITQ